MLAQRGCGEMINKNWLKQRAEEIKARIPFVFPQIDYQVQIEEEEGVLSGRTRLEKKKEVNVIITVFMSRNLLERPNLEPATKLILIHELCHVVSPFNPDAVMKKYFPKEFGTWLKLENLKAIQCQAEIKELKLKEAN